MYFCILCGLAAEAPKRFALFTFRDLPGLPQFFHSDVLVFTVQVAVFVGLLLFHVFYYKLEKKKREALLFYFLFRHIRLNAFVLEYS